MTKQYFKDHGERLVELGYRIVPIPPGTKGPRLSGWQKLNLTAADVRKKATNGSADAGIGILAATTPAIDVDVMDKDLWCIDGSVTRAHRCAGGGGKRGIQTSLLITH